MVYVLVLIAALVVSWVIVRIGAIAFQITGLEWSLAKFQALSCFSGTGFTTKEAELITGDKRRRQIATILMILGNAGMVTLIASAVGALNPEHNLLPWLEENFLNTPINLAVLAAALFLVYKILTNRKITGKLTRYLRKKIIKQELLKPVSFEELLMLTGGYGISKIEVCEGNPIIDKTLAESDLRKNDITVLAIIRGEETIPNPSANRKILKGDGLISFGKLERLRSQVCEA
jgi:Trk-type K+ transport system membrane component